MKIWRNVLIGVVVVAVLFFAGRWLLNRGKASTTSKYQTEVAQRGSLTATIGATGTVHPNQTANLAWQASGTVASVPVKVGQVVQAGQTLAELDPASLSQNVILAQADLASSQKALEDLKNVALKQVQARQVISTTQKAVIEAESALAKFDETQYKDKLDQAKNDLANAEKTLKQAKDDFDPYKDWDPANTTYKSYKDRLDDAQRKRDEAARKLDLTEMDKSLAQLNLEVARAQHDNALQAYEKVKDGPDARDIAALEARIAAAQATLNLATLTAPFAGVVTTISIQPGDAAAPGKAAFRLDDLSHLFVDVRVSEVDVNRIQTGQTVNLTFDAILGTEYHGTITDVAGVGNAVQGVVEFSVEIALTDGDAAVKPGMTAAVNVVIEQLENVLLVPNRAVRVLDGQRVVYVLRSGKLQPVNITLGASSENYSQVSDGGLLAGDAIVLNPPTIFEGGPFGGR